MNQTNDCHDTLSFSVTKCGEPKTRSFTIGDKGLQESATLETYKVESSDGFIKADVTVLEVKDSWINISGSAIFGDGQSTRMFNGSTSRREKLESQMLEMFTRLYMEVLQEVEDRKLREEREQEATLDKGSDG